MTIEPEMALSILCKDLILALSLSVDLKEPQIAYLSCGFHIRQLITQLYSYQT